jgi:hypothetical protein
MATILQSSLWAENLKLWTAESNDWDFGSSDADSYENIAYERVIESLQNIIRNEFKVPVIDEHRGNQSFVIDFQEDTLIEYFASGQTRSYDLDIIYTLMRGGGFKSVKTQLTTMAEHTKRLIFNNSHYQPSGVYKYHDGRIESVTYEQDEDDLDLWRASMAFNCTVTEVYK